MLVNFPGIDLNVGYLFKIQKCAKFTFTSDH